MAPVHDVRPLAELGIRQAQALVAVIATLSSAFAIPGHAMSAGAVGTRCASPPAAAPSRPTTRFRPDPATELLSS
jgi:hypothetical protein